MNFFVCFFLRLFINDLKCCDSSWKLVWSDEFDGDRLDHRYWDYDLGTGCQFGICGWGNAELQYYTNSTRNSYIQSGHLVIDAVKEQIDKSDYTSARLVTRGKIQWRFGKIQVRVKIPEGNGLWPAVWMLPTDKVYGEWPRSGEIDIVEILGKEPSIAYCTAHYGYAWNNKSQKTDVMKNAESFADVFHLFEVEWEFNRIEWFIDGKSILVVTKDDITTDGFIYPFNEDFHLIINLAVGGHWPQSPDNSTKFPASLLIDYVRVYQKK